ncbi:MAG TPA: AAA family ATPase [Ramlibacter sp.]|uniref:trifunctional serine/threonine-protein kinase/ATP-binding protein/sensor histidine kinase n=1 Tax=Ramlibacter sp. TaxID=1917967 RepID=UPI002D13534B|nr:AAA family ATPase [Ramlibacter sp.]HVZ44820.1 AAA family ATPase [Ramlibacter sp.]
MTGSSFALSGRGAEGRIELLYESPTTRVFRELGPLGAIVCKEPLGADAPERIRHERAMLERLAGVEGVAHLAAGLSPQGALALQDCGGVSLAQVLRSRGIRLDAILPLAQQLARTLAAVHRRGVIHRDINPANILLAATGDAVLIDFDLAMRADQHPAAGEEGHLLGTLAYLAPEQTGRTGRIVDQRADLYALGVTLYELATGRLPFEAQDTLQLIHHHMVREPLAPSQLDARVPAGFSAIVMRLMAKAPGQRYQGAEGLLHDLQRLRGELDAGRPGLFELGERDFPARLAPPRALVGRASEIATLRAAFAESQRSSHATVLVEGPAGVGKSALVGELRPIVAAAGGWFVHGKFDQYQKDAATAGAVTHAGRALGRLLLALPPEQLAVERRRILERLGRNAAVVTRMSPEFALLLGEQPEVVHEDPRQAELHLQQAVVDLLAAVASPKRPLVVVIDDLQWAGALSLRGFGRLVGEPGLRGVVLVGAWRSEELVEGHALAPMLAQWSGLPQPPLRISLANLGEADLAELVGGMLRLPVEGALQLARAVHSLTAGNPFDTVEMVNALRNDGVLRLDDAGWRWNSAEVRRFVGGGNVVDLLAARIARLSADTRELMELMGCLGNSVERGLLAIAAGADEDELRRRLAPALEDGLVMNEPAQDAPALRFRHDRVQQAVMAAMDHEHRARQQHAMARRLAAHPGFESEAAQQYLPCIGRLHDRAEQQRAARLFLDLARKLAATATYQLADRYLAAAGDLLRAVGDPTDAGSLFEVAAGRHAALYSLGRLEESDPQFEAMQSSAADPLAMVEPTCLQMRSLFMRGRTQAAKELGLALLARLGLEAPPDYTTPDAQARMDSLAQWVREDAARAHAGRTPIREPRLLAIAKLLTRLARPAYFSPGSLAFRWLLLESQRMWAEHGPCPELVASLGRMSSMLITLRQDYRTAYEIARHVLAVGEAFAWEPQTSEARFIFCTFAGHWFERVEDVLRQSRRAFEGVRASGDASYAGYVHAGLITSVLETAPTIEQSVAEVESGIALCARVGNVHAAAQHTCELQMLRALAGRTSSPESFDDAQFAEADFLARLGSLPYMRHTYAECRAMHGLIMGNASLLVPNALLGMSTAGDVAGYYMTVYAHFFHAMARARQLQTEGTGADRAALLAALEESRAWLAARALDQPHNFAHLSHLVQAEEAWVLGDGWKAAAAFDRALAESLDAQRPWHRAVITERAALFHLSRGLVHAGRGLLAEAREQFAAWGASAKVQALEREHDFLRPHEPQPGASDAARASSGSTSRSSRGSTSGISSDALDLMGVLSASQALSSETGLERLIARVTEVLAALTGATKVLVLAWSHDEWWLLAPAAGEASLPLRDAAERGMVPVSAIGYAERTREPLLVDDAIADDRFARDPYFADHAQCSLLVVPIAGQGAARAMLMLENTDGRAAFNAQRLDAVMLIAGQLAVSLANAQLYESLEQRVQSRTRELQEMQAQLVATARRAGKAEVATNVLHNVGNVLNSINVSASVVRRTIGNSRLHGLGRVVALLHEHQDDLAEFMGRDDRAKALLAYLGELEGTLRHEHDEAMSDIERVIDSVAHISWVVAAQQSHAGPSTVLETARPQEIIEEALRLSTEAIAQGAVHVVVRSDGVPAVSLDRPRLLQILVNLVSNAAQAMHDMPLEARELTVAAAIVSGGSGETLRITVEDTGEGIAPENLSRIFSHGFTTRRDGHGFGLHSSALAAVEMGGKLTVHSDGPGRGAVFALELPLTAR